MDFLRGSFGPFETGAGLQCGYFGSGMCAPPASFVEQKQRSPRCQHVITVTLWQLNPRGFLRQLQGEGVDILKGSGYCLILQELRAHEDGLDFLGAGGWHHPIPGRAWGGDGCDANDGEK